MRPIRFCIAALLAASALYGQVTKDGVYTLIDFPQGASTQVWSINSRGEMVGVYVSSDNVTHGFLMSAGRFKTIDYPGAALTRANGINAQGDIVGVYATPANGPTHGFLLSSGRFTTIDVPGAASTYVTGIAANGDIAGDSGNPARGFLLSGDKFTKIDYPESTTTVMGSISPQGDVVASYAIGGVIRAMLYRQGQIVTTWEYPGANGFTNAIGRNAAGDTVGRYLDAARVSHGYLLSNGQFTSFDFPGATFTGMAGITPDGDIVGRAQINGVFHGFVLKRGQQPRYQMTDLGTLGGKMASAFGVSNAGVVSGWAAVANGDQHPVMWRDGKAVDLGNLGGGNGSASIPTGSLQMALATETAIADPFRADFCGYGTGRTCVAAMWKDGKLTQLPTLGGNNAIGYFTNERGQMVGVAERSAADPKCKPPQKLGFAPVIWSPKGEIQELKLPTGDTAGWAITINDKGEAIGATGNCADTVAVVNGALNGKRAVLWENGVPRDLGSFGGDGDTVAVGLNNRTEIVGSSALPDGTSHAFLWSRENGLEDIGALEGDALGALSSINNARQAVGGSCDADFNCRAMFWERYTMTDLNDLVPADSTLYLAFATWINDVGEIVGLGVDKKTEDLRAFLLTPIKPAAAAKPSMVRALPLQLRTRLRQQHPFSPANQPSGLARKQL